MAEIMKLQVTYKTLNKDTLNFSLFVYLSALSLKVETLYAGEEEEGGKGILPRVNEEKRLVPAYKAYMSRKFLQITTGQIRKKQPPTNPTTNKPPHLPKKTHTEKDAQPNLRYAL